mmetsp:Transcript_114082/g.322622  ORF Transcript_114082/g.322622 Transcript_114082/m.322622 type:complete len:312 (+) Transcript_114082:511-1446(+)
MGHGGLLERGPVHLRAHHDHLVDRLHHLLGRLPGDRLRVQGVCPVDVFDERVGGGGELAGGRADGGGGAARDCRSGTGRRDGVGLHDVGELDECAVRPLRILLFNHGHEVGRHFRVHECRDGVVDVHRRRLRHRRYHAADGGIDRRQLGLRADAVSGQAHDGLVMGVGSGGQQLRVHGGTHSDHFADGLRPAGRVGRPRAHTVEARIPGDLLHEGVRGLRELGGSVSNGVGACISGGTQDGRHAGGKRGTLGTRKPRRGRRYEDRAVEQHNPRHHAEEEHRHAAASARHGAACDRGEDGLRAGRCTSAKKP